MSAVRDRIPIVLFSVVAVVVLAGQPVVGDDKLYKWVDEEGNVTYQDQPPPGQDGQVETLVDNLGGSDAETAVPDVDVVLYSIEVCDSCDLVRKVLNDEAVPFEEKMADDDAEIQSEIREVAGTLSVPVLVIGERVLIGYNKQMILRDLQEAGFTGPGAAAGQSGEPGQAAAREPASADEAGEAAPSGAADDDLFGEEEGFILDEDIFADDGSAGNGSGDGDDITELEEIPEDERIRVGE